MRVIPEGIRPETPVTYAYVLTANVRGRLHRCGIYTVADLQSRVDELGVDGLSALPGIGPTSVAELREQIERSCRDGVFDLDSPRMAKYRMDAPRWVVEDWRPRWAFVEPMIRHLNELDAAIAVSQWRDRETLEQTAKKVGLTRERIRQKLLMICRKLFVILSWQDD